MISIADINPSRMQTLDFCYEKQAQALKNMRADVFDKNTLKAVSKWLEIFQVAPLEQKHARNCLALLMQEQLAAEGTLSNLFLKPENFKLDLNEVLNEVDRELDEIFSESSDTPKRFEPNIPDMYNLIANQGSAMPIAVENEHLRGELNVSHAKILEKDKIIKNLESQIHGAIKTETKTSTEKVLKTMIDVIAQYLGDNQFLEPRESGNIRLNLFESICGWLTKESWFINQLRVFDVTFEQFLNNMLQNELTKIKNEVAANATKSFKKIHKKMRKQQKHRLTVQRRKHDTQIGLIKLEIFSELRKVFVNLQTSKDPNMWKILEQMEEKYAEIADKVIKNLTKF